MTFDEIRNYCKSRREQAAAQPTTEQRISAAENAIADLAIQLMTTGGDGNV